MKMDEYLSRKFVLSCVDSFLSKTDMPIAAQYFYDCFRECEAANVQPVNQWISVDNRLPESEKEVLVWYKYTWDAWFTSYGFGINVWYSNTKQWRDGCLLKGVEVLYWQLLPEPPKDGDAE